MTDIKTTPRMLRLCFGFSVGALTLALALASCGPQEAFEDPSAVADMDTNELAFRWDVPASDPAEAETRRKQESNLERLLNELRQVLQPLFDLYGVPADPIVDNRMAPELRAMLRDVRIHVRAGNVVITNRATGAVIFSGPLADLSSGTFNAENMPGGSGTTPPPACSYTYSDWSACQSDGKQSRSVTGSSPAGCTGTPVLSQSCTYVPPAPAACTYTYSAWGACQSNGTQSRTVTASSPAGCSGTPVLTQSCTYVPPAPAACTYTYSAWGACQSNGTQSRTVTASSPAGCTGTPVLTQSCTYVPPAPSCGSCHAIPPATGKHTKHVSSYGTSCATCHGSGYSKTAVNSSLHQNGNTDIASGIGYNGSSCSNSCHGSKSW